MKNPYVGTRPFDTGETLYGRDREANDLRIMLVAKRLVLLHSPSGAGKTSLIQAALIPDLTDDDFEVLPIIRVITTEKDTPPPGTNRYVYSMLRSLEKDSPPQDGLDQSDSLPYTGGLGGASATTTISHYLAQRLQTSTTKELVLIFDQFEEILTSDPTDQEQKHEFFRQLGDALYDMDNYWVLFAMREDYVAALEPYLHPLPTRLKSRFRLDLLGEDAALKAMQQPAHEQGVTFADDAARKLCDDLRQVQVQQLDGSKVEQPGPYVEPMHLQVVCHELWDKIQPDSTTPITTANIDPVDSVGKSLAGYYAQQVQNIAQETGTSERAIREWIGTQLITKQDTRGQVQKGVDHSENLHNDVIYKLINAYLVRAEKRRGIDWFELAHDRLIEPVKANNEEWRKHNLSPLQQQSEIWEQQGRPPDSFLLRGQELTEAEAWATAHPNEMIERDRAYLDACQRARDADQRARDAEKHEREQRFYRIVGIAAVVAFMFALIAAGAAWVASNARTEAEDERDRANQQQQIAETVRADAEQEAHARATAEANAVERAHEAVAQSNIALSRQLAARSVNNQEQDIELALLLAVQADTVTSTVESKSALLDGLQVSPHLSTTLREHSSNVFSVAFSPDGTMLASASCGERDEDNDCIQGEIRLWGMTTDPPTLLGEPLRGHTDAVNSVAFSPDGRTLASGSSDDTIRLWDVATQDALGEPLRGHTHFVNSVAFSPDGRTLASGSLDETIRLWDVARPDQPTALGEPLTEHASYVSSVAFSPDGRTLASGSWDATIRLWDVAQPEQPKALAEPLRGHTEGVSSVAFSPDGRTLASGSADNTIRLWDVANPTQATALGEPLTEHTGSVYSVAFSPDGRTLASGSWDDTIRLWDVAKQEQIGEPMRGHTNSVSSVAFSPDGRTLASASCGERESRNCTQGEIRLWDVAQPDQATALAEPLLGHTDAVNSVAFSPDGRTLASGSLDETIRLWDVTTQEALGEPLRGHTDYVRSVAFSPDGRTLASGSDDNTIHLWDVAQPEKPTALGEPLRGHTEGVSSVAFSPDGRTLASGSVDATIRLWDVARADHPTALGEPLRGHTSYVWSVAFSPDGRTLASGSMDNTIRLWDVARADHPTALGEPLRGHTSYVWSVAFSPDGQTLASGSADNTIRLWDVSVDSWKARACRASGRNLTWEEWQRTMGNTTPYTKTCATLPVHASVIAAGDEMATTGDIDAATAHYEYIQTLDLTLTFDPRQRAIKLAIPGLVERGEQLAEDGNVVKATEKFSAALALSPTLALDPRQHAVELAVPALIEQGEQWAEWGNVPKATETFSVALALSPTLALDPQRQATELAVSALVEQGKQWAKRGYVPKATEKFSAALALSPTLALELKQQAFDALVGAGDTLAEDGNVLEATETFSVALELWPTLALDPQQRATELAILGLVEHGEQLAEDGAVLKATEKFSAALELSPTLALDTQQRARELVDVFVLSQKGQRLAQESNIAEATETFRAALELSPTLTVGSKFRAISLGFLGLSEAEEPSTVSTPDPEQWAKQIYAATLVLRGDEAALAGDTSDALDHYKDALDLDPTLPFDPQKRVKEVRIYIGSHEEDFYSNADAVTIAAGTPITVTFSNYSDTQDHNWVLLKHNDMQRAEALVAAAEQAANTGYIPLDNAQQMETILAYLAAIEPNAWETVSFAAPAPGKYLYISTVPGHFERGQYGVLEVLGE